MQWYDRELTAFGMSHRTAPPEPLLSVGTGAPLSAINVINSMYSGLESAVKLPDDVTDTFPQYVGLKQGCPLSPLLFNIHINDLEEFLKKEGHGILIGNKEISSLLFEDDVVLMGNNAEDLQRLINGMATYSLQWGLVVNTNKTQIIIFNKSRQVCLLGNCFRSERSLYTHAEPIITKSQLSTVLLLRRDLYGIEISQLNPQQL